MAVFGIANALCGAIGRLLGRLALVHGGAGRTGLGHVEAGEGRSFSMSDGRHGGGCTIGSLEAAQGAIWRLAIINGRWGGFLSSTELRRSNPRDGLATGAATWPAVLVG